MAVRLIPNRVAIAARRSNVRVRIAMHRAAYGLLGRARGNRVPAYWYVDVTNFGDWITPLILGRYGLTPVHAPPARAEVVAAGSILEEVPPDYAGYIVGAGLQRDTVRRFERARILAVRGELTRRRIGAAGDVVLGDPGLLASRFVAHRQPKRYALGIVPHYVDRNDLRIRQLRRRYGRDVLVIDVRRKPRAVFEDIDRCERIVSSSLHGLIAADSLGIPSGWMRLSERVEGAGFKFFDYASALRADWDPICPSGDERLSELTGRTRTPPAAVEERKEALDGVFRELAETLGAASRSRAGSPPRRRAPRPPGEPP